MRQRRIVIRMLVSALAFSLCSCQLLSQASSPYEHEAIVTDDPPTLEESSAVEEPPTSEESPDIEGSLELEATIIDHNGIEQGASPEPYSHAAVSHAYRDLDDGFPATSLSLIKNWAYDRALERMRVVYVILRDPIAIEPWEADWDPDITEAKDDGSLTEWDDHYYVTHFWSYYGQIILDLQPGDVVTVNGEPMRVEGIFDYPKDSILAEILALTGEDATVLQTCVPDEDYNRIVFGH